MNPGHNQYHCCSSSQNRHRCLLPGQHELCVWHYVIGPDLQALSFRRDCLTSVITVLSVTVSFIYFLNAFSDVLEHILVDVTITVFINNLILFPCSRQNFTVMASLYSSRNIIVYELENMIDN